MEHACRVMTALKLAGNGPNVASFAGRGGPSGAKRTRAKVSVRSASRPLCHI
jgi:hypothetical protein